MSVFRSSRRRPPPPTLFPYTTLFRSHTFQTIAERQGRVIGGLSMGGYGAIKLALKFPQLFCSAVSHSARSEEHTSELQSHSDLVCRLLLEKKNEFWSLAFSQSCLRCV